MILSSDFSSREKRDDMYELYEKDIIPSRSRIKKRTMSCNLVWWVFWVEEKQRCIRCTRKCNVRQYYRSARSSRGMTCKMGILGYKSGLYRLSQTGLLAKKKLSCIRCTRSQENKSTQDCRNTRILYKTLRGS